MDVYNSKLAKLLGKWHKQEKFAITTSSTCTRYSCKLEEVGVKWRTHEDQHKWQIRRIGWISFMSSYLWHLATEGYDHNQYEVEAQNAANTPMI